VTPVRGTDGQDARATFWTVRDGRRVTIRPLDARALEPFAAFVRRLSATSRAQRFFAAVCELGAEAVHRLVLVDQRQSVAWIAVDALAPHAVVGEVRYAATAPHAAEFAVAVADGWHRQGLGSLLLRRLLAHASAAGIRFAWGHVRCDNAVALAVARRLGLGVAPDPDDRSLLIVRHPMRPGPSRRRLAPDAPAGGQSPDLDAGDR